MRKLKKTKVKLLVTLLSFVLLFCGTMGSSLAWLLDKTEDVTNTFEPSTIGVTLAETTNNFKMIPGHSINKNPIITVNSDSEDCFVFVKVDESENLSSYIKYAVDVTENATSDEENIMRGGWIRGLGTADNVDKENMAYGVPTNVYFRIVHKAKTNQTFGILASGEYLFDIKKTPVDTTDDMKFTWGVDHVLTKPDVTKTMMDSLTKNPTLTFTAAAVQLYKSNGVEFSAKEAYELVDWTQVTNP